MKIHRFGHNTSGSIISFMADTFLLLCLRLFNSAQKDLMLSSSFSVDTDQNILDIYAKAVNQI